MGRKSISNTFCVSTIQDGQRGKVGRFFYYGGEWDETLQSTQTFVINDAQAPYFKHTSSGQVRYHVYDPVENPSGRLTMAQMWATSNYSWNNAPWVAMTNDFDYLITKAIFADFAKFGSAIVSGDWIISGNGKIDGVSFHTNDVVDAVYFSKGCEDGSFVAYTLFDSSKPSNAVESICYIKNKSLTSTTSPHKVSLATISLVSGKMYSVRAFGRQYNSQGSLWVRVMSGNYSGDVVQLYKSGDDVSSSHNYQTFFSVSTSGSYSFSLEEKGVGSGGTTYYGGIADFFEVSEVAFEPILALDLLSGKSIQRESLYSGFLRKEKTVINQLNVSEYTNIRTLLFEKTGCFIEIKDGVVVDLVLPLLYRNGSGDVTIIGANNEDYVRSLVGTKLLIYLTDGHIYGDEIEPYADRVLNIDGTRMTNTSAGSRYDSNSGEIKIHDTFEWRISHEAVGGSIPSSYKTYQRDTLVSGQFTELECMSDIDNDGYETIYWRVNKKGYIASYT